MKRTRSILIAVALGTGICSFALPSVISTCELQPQYALVNGRYVPAGTFGVDYICGSLPMTCTYVLSVGQYVPCRVGSYEPVFLTK